VKRRVLVTGGAGFIGSHTCKQLAAHDFEPVTFDNLSTGNRQSVQWGPLVESDILDTVALVDAIEKFDAQAVIHFAASAYVGDSVREPTSYYRNNVEGTRSVLDACRATGTDKLVFSSSCATYGVPTELPISEATPQAPINPYGRTKLVGEWMADDSERAFGLKTMALRYFNACGADPDGEIGEWHDPETHLIPRALMAAFGIASHLDIFGTDYPTADGTCVRDYIHVADLAIAHVLALQHLIAGGQAMKLNIGTGKGWSIREIVAAVERTTGREVPLAIGDRRPGDPPTLVADGRSAMDALGFTPRFSDLETIVSTAALQYQKGRRDAA
jgi:UDP-arabinose 4-epimerase